MEEASIQFFCEDLDFSLPQAEKTRQWIQHIAEEQGYAISQVNYIFCSDAYLLNINIEYLQHDTYTDIITFDNAEETGVLESDIFISLERVRENAQSYGVKEEEELRRVMAHGLLHLMGQGDKTPEEAQQMREKEAHCLTRWPAS